MQIKLFIFIVFLVLFCSSIAQAQACGGSVRTIELEFAEMVKKPEKVNYELFYVAPNVKSVSELSYEKMTEFVSNFYYGYGENENAQPWRTNNSTTEFLIIPNEKAENYLLNYNLKYFKPIYEDGFRKHHLRQLKGEFEENKLELDTSEMDYTPFLMKITAENFETQYFLADFLGGCHSGDKQKIKMKLGI